GVVLARDRRLHPSDGRRRGRHAPRGADDRRDHDRRGRGHDHKVARRCGHIEAVHGEVLHRVRGVTVKSLGEALGKDVWTCTPSATLRPAALSVSPVMLTVYDVTAVTETE